MYVELTLRHEPLRGEEGTFVEKKECGYFKKKDFKKTVVSFVAGMKDKHADFSYSIDEFLKFLNHDVHTDMIFAKLVEEGCGFALECSGTNPHLAKFRGRQELRLNSLGTKWRDDDDDGNPPAIERRIRPRHLAGVE